MNNLSIQNLMMISLWVSSIMILITILMFRLGFIPAFYKGFYAQSRVEYGRFATLLLLTIVVLVGVITIVVVDPTVLYRYETPITSSNLVYHLTVQDPTNGQPVQDAQILIEINGREYMTDLTDSNGLSIIVVSSDLSEQSAQLIVKADGYNIYTQKVTLIENGWPSFISLEPND